MKIQSITGTDAVSFEQRVNLLESLVEELLKEAPEESTVETKMAALKIEYK